VIFQGESKAFFTMLFGQQGAFAEVHGMKVEAMEKILHCGRTDVHSPLQSQIFGQLGGGVLTVLFDDVQGDFIFR
jgi:hypothetical protein